MVITNNSEFFIVLVQYHMFMDPVCHILKRRQVRGCPTALQVVPCPRARVRGCEGSNLSLREDDLDTQRVQKC